MEKVNLENLKKLRNETGASVADIKTALLESNDDYEKALAWLKKRGAEIAEKKKSREAGEGLVDAYIHGNGKVGVLLSILCETDFVARTDDFKNLAHEISMQIAAMDPKDTDTLLEQEYIRDPGRKISDLIKEAVGRLGENIKVEKFVRFEI